MKAVKKSPAAVVRADFMQWRARVVADNGWAYTKSGRIMSKQQISFAIDQIVRKHGYATVDELIEAEKAEKLTQ